METTINLHIDNLTKITHAAELCGISRSETIMLIIKEMMNHIPDADRIGNMVRYQNRSNPDEWHTFHIQVRMDEYEYLLDLRKLFKMSVSLIIAYAVERYLKKLIKLKGTDNYRFKNYVVIREVVDSIICWRLYWGYPRNLEKLIPHSPAANP
jgi:hypothetical protein